MTDIDKAALEAALENLRTHQKQLDADGIMVGVSRQALEEVLAYFDALTEGDTEEPARVNHTLNSYIANCPTKGSVNVPRESLESIAASIAAQAAEIAELRRSCEGGGGSYACRDCPDADYCMSAGACLHVSEAAPQATDDDLVARLEFVRDVLASLAYLSYADDVKAAADRIEQLERKLAWVVPLYHRTLARGQAAEQLAEKYQTALRPFADAARDCIDSDDLDGNAWEHAAAMAVTINDFRNAEIAVDTSEKCND